jgi:UDPglucose 6-dehydrogenase
MVEGGTTVAVLGLAYKPFSHIVEESQGIYLAKALSKAGARVVAFDPLAAETANMELRGQIVILDSITDCLAQAEVVLVTTPDPAFEALTHADFDREKPQVTVFDFWRILDRQQIEKGNIRYVPIGHSIDDEANTARLASLWSSTAHAPE